MSEFSCTRRDLSLLLIESDTNYVDSISNYIRNNFTESSDANIAKTIASIQKSFIIQFRQRYTKCGRKKEQFLNQNSNWLDGIFTVNLEKTTCEPEPSTSTEKRGRPSKTYDDSSESTKKWKNKGLLDTCGLDFILNSYVQGLRSRGEVDGAFIVDILRALPAEKKSEMRSNLLNEPAHITAYSKDDALSIFIELDYQEKKSFVMSKRGRPLLLYNNYTYSKYPYPLKTGLRWYCSKVKNCRAYLFTTHDNVVLRAYGSHAHSPTESFEPSLGIPIKGSYYSSCL